MRDKGQAAVEYIIIFGIGLFIVGVLWIFAMQESERTRFEVQITYAKNAMNKIVDTADIVSIQGPPAQTYVNIVFPDNLRGIAIQGNSVTFELGYRDFTNNLTATSIANLSGNISPVPGAHKILVRASNNYVEIVDG